LFPPTKPDPNGIHAAIWEEVEDASFSLPSDQPLTIAAYECGPITGAYLDTVAIGASLPEMPLYIEPARYVSVPLEGTYNAAFTALPRRWQQVLDPPVT